MLETAHPDCPFCPIVAGAGAAQLVRQWPDAVAIRPRSGGVADGHLLVIPRRHVVDVGEDPAVSAAVMRRAAELAAELPAANIITSKGSAATQTVRHLHVHVVPRTVGDGLPLPWTPRPATHTVTVVMAREPLPTTGTVVFLAGPTPTPLGAPSWRLRAIEELAAQWTGPGPLTVLSPESRGGVRAERYEDQVEWETDARAHATVVLFWIPRDVASLPGFTTNVEFGLDVSTGRVVLGCPPHCPNPERNRYLILTARRYGAPVCETLADTVAAALVKARTPAAGEPK